MARCRGPRTWTSWNGAPVTTSSWDTATSGQTTSAGARGRRRAGFDGLGAIAHANLTRHTYAGRLNSYSDIRPVVAESVLAEVPKLGTCGSQQVAALVGIGPFDRTAAPGAGPRAIWGGRARVRAALYTLAMTETRVSPTSTPGNGASVPLASHPSSRPPPTGAGCSSFATHYANTRLLGSPRGLSAPARVLSPRFSLPTSPPPSSPPKEAASSPPATPHS